MKNSLRKECLVLTLPILLAACGGGGGGSDPAGYSATTPGAGSSVASAETAVKQGSIKYGQYRAGDVELSASGWTLPSVTATVNFDPASKQGSIAFPLGGATETVSTADAYDTVSWAGPLSSGAYRFQGNILMGCSAAGASPNEVTQVFVSSSLTRVQNGAVDNLSGLSFDVFDCAMLKQGNPGSAKFNSDGSLALSIANASFPKNQVFDLLNPEKYPGILVNDGAAQVKGVYSGHAYRYDANNTTRYAIVIQTNAGSMTGANRYHYYLAVQR